MAQSTETSMDDIVGTGIKVTQIRTGVVIQLGFHWKNWKIKLFRPKDYKYEPFQFGPFTFTGFIETDQLVEKIDE